MAVVSMKQLWRPAYIWPPDQKMEPKDGSLYLHGT